MLQHMVKPYAWLLLCLYYFYLFILKYVIHIISSDLSNLHDSIYDRLIMFNFKIFFVIVWG